MGYLAVDSKRDLYAATIGLGNNVLKFKPGSTKGVSMNLKVGDIQGLAVDTSGNILIVDGTANTFDVFPPGKTRPSKAIPFSGTPDGLALNAAQTEVYLSENQGNSSYIQGLAYPDGKQFVTEIPNDNVGAAIAVSPDIGL